MWSAKLNIFYLSFYMSCLCQSLIQILTCMLPADRGLTTYNMGNLIRKLSLLPPPHPQMKSMPWGPADLLGPSAWGCQQGLKIELYSPRQTPSYSSSFSYYTFVRIMLCFSAILKWKTLSLMLLSRRWLLSLRQQ